MLRLFTTFYPEKNPARRAEYVECLRRNLACGVIDEICILAEGECPDLPDSPKLRIRAIGTRPHYSDFFTWINELAGAADFSVVANTDIWFEGSILTAVSSLKARECLALARWDAEVLFDRNDSQDCWGFRGRVTGVEGDFPLGVVRCDNRMLYELQAAGYRVKNPARSIRTGHLHAGERGEYGVAGANFVAPPYRYQWPHNLWGPVRTAWHNFRHPDRRVQWSLDRRKIRASRPCRLIRKLTGWPRP